MQQTSHLRVAGIVLAGGLSSRMGRPKAWLPFGPETLLQRVVRIVGEVVGPVVVVAATNQDLPSLPAEVRVVRDEREAQGPLEGLRVGLRSLVGFADAAYATSCDVPFLTPQFVRAIIERLGDHDVVVPVEVEGERVFHHPLAAAYRVSLTPRLDTLIESGRLRPVFLYEESRTLRVPVDDLRAVDPRLDALRNLNHPADYEQALADL